MLYMRQAAAIKRQAFVATPLVTAGTLSRSSFRWGALQRTSSSSRRGGQVYTIDTRYDAESALDSGSDDVDLQDGIDLARKPWTKEAETICWLALRDSCLHGVLPASRAAPAGALGSSLCSAPFFLTAWSTPE